MTKRRNILYSVLAVLVVCVLLGISIYFLLPKPEKLELFANDISLKVDESKLIMYDINKEAQVIFKVQDEDVATTSNSSIIGKKAGETSLKITAFVGKEICDFVCKVVVSEKDAVENPSDNDQKEEQTPPKTDDDTSKDDPSDNNDQNPQEPSKEEQPDNPPKEDPEKPEEPPKEDPADPSGEEKVVPFDYIALKGCERINETTLYITAGVEARIKMFSKDKKAVIYQLSSDDISLTKMNDSSTWKINSTTGGTIQVKVDGALVGEIVVIIKSN